ncbi:MAG: cobalamin-binding protein [Actinomycetota bacterium]
MRIVSLLPSATDIVCSLGLRDSLVGRTHECDWPPGIADVPVMTRDTLDTQHMRSAEIDSEINAAVHSGSSIYRLDQDALSAAKPDLIITQELCDVCAVSYSEVTAAARVMECGPTVLSLEPRSIDEILDNVRVVASHTGSDPKAIIDEANERLDRVRKAVAGTEPVRTVCVEWLDPPYEAGHWVPEQVSIAGGIEIFDRLGVPSRRTTWEAVLEARPESMVMMPCGFSMERTIAELDRIELPDLWNEIEAVKLGNVWIVNGPAYFNRPGPRVIRGVEILAHVLHGVGDADPSEALLWDHR